MPDFYDDGRTLDQIPLDRCYGPARRTSLSGLGNSQTMFQKASFKRLEFIVHEPF